MSRSKITNSSIDLSSAAEPTNPGNGQLWWDPTSETLKVYTGNSWIQAATSFIASGGEQIITANHTYHVFKSSGTFTVSSGTRPADIFILGGGGGAGAEYSGGGGAGGALWASGFQVSVGSYQIVVGAGGAGNSGSGGYDNTRNDGAFGGNSSFATFTALGGAGSVGYDNIEANAYTGGGCGAGSPLFRGNSTDLGGDSAQTAPSPTWTAYGNDAGDQITATWDGSTAARGGSGGGGTGEPGEDCKRAAFSSGYPGGAGGNGLRQLAGLTESETAEFFWKAQVGTDSSNTLVTSLSAQPSVIYLGGGGGGCHEAGGNASGGLGGGTTGYGSESYTNASSNTGSGGGGKIGYSGQSAAGGSGVVIIRY